MEKCISYPIRRETLKNKVVAVQLIKIKLNLRVHTGHLVSFIPT